MTPESLEQTARQFDKLKAKTPTELADWARENVPALIDQVRLALNDPPSEGVQALWALFPGVPAEDVFQLAADDIRATRAERAAKHGNAPPARASALTEALETLRPFAALGSPVTLRTIERAAAAQGIDWNRDDVVHIADEDGVCVCRITVEQAEAALNLIGEFDTK